MTNKKLIEKLQEDMEMRGFSHYTKDSYLRKTKEIVKYFGKPMRQVTTKELRYFLLKYLRGEKQIGERSVNYYNSVIRFIYDVVLDYPINHKQLPMYKKKRKLPKILSEEELNVFFNACDNYMYKTIVNVNIKMYIFLKIILYKIVHFYFQFFSMLVSSLALTLSFSLYDFPLIFITCE